MASLWVSRLACHVQSGERARFRAVQGPLVCALTLAACVTGCALDTRKLHEAEMNGAGGGAGGSSNTSSGSHGGPKAPPPIDLPVCSYSDGVMAGCESIVPNAGFRHGIEGWQAEPLAISVDWDARDADGSKDSGSISVTNSMDGKTDGLAPGGGMQCLPAAAGDIFDMAGDVYIPDGQSDGAAGAPSYIGEAGLSILFWPTSDCSETSPTKANFQTKLVEDPGSWTHVQGAALAPDSTAAMSVRVLTIKPFKQVIFRALFDNLLLKKR